MNNQSRYAVSLDEAARRLSISRRSVDRLIVAGSLESFTLGTRRLIETGELKRLVAERIAA